MKYNRPYLHTLILKMEEDIRNLKDYSNHNHGAHKHEIEVIEDVFGWLKKDVLEELSTNQKPF